MSEFSNLGEKLSEKAGPIPVWGWIVGLVGAYYFYYKKKSTASVSPTATSTTDSTAQTSNTGDQGYAGAMLTAQYEQLNALGLNTSELGVLNSSVGSNTTATGANTSATTANTTATQANTAVINPVAAPPPTTLAAAYQKALTGINAVIQNYTAHGPTYNLQAQGATAVAKVINPRNSTAQNKAQAQLVINNYASHGPTYASQLAGAKAALAKIT